MIYVEMHKLDIMHFAWKTLHLFSLRVCVHACVRACMRACMYSICNYISLVISRFDLVP